MYNQEITDQQLWQVGKDLNVKLVRYDDERLEEMNAQLDKAVEERDRWGFPTKIRTLTPVEREYIKNERLVVKYDFPYYFTRYCHTLIKLEGQPVLMARVKEPLEPQRLFMQHLANHEVDIAQGKAEDGYMYAACKARQEGYTTLGRAISTHRVFFWEDTRALAASADDVMILELYDRDHTIYDHLPWWLKPTVEYDTKGQQFTFGKMKSSITYAQGNQKGGLGVGKGQLPSAKILTPEGWITLSALSVGALVMGRDGKAYPITGIYPRGLQPTYKLTFSDDTSLICDADHLWTIQTNKRARRGAKEQTLSVKQLLKRGLYTKQGAVKSYIPLVAPLNFVGKAYKIHPYVLGMLLGDGCISQKTVGIASEDDLSFIQSLLPEGLILKKKQWKDKCPMWFIQGPQNKNTIKTALKTMGLMGKTSRNKFIPKEYLYGDTSTRHAVLQGLLDSDGYAKPKSCFIEFGSSSVQLTDDVVFLVQSLGGTARKVYRPATTSFRLYIALPNSFEGFRLPRKRDCVIPRTKYFPRRGLVNIEEAGIQETICISVASPDFLYVTENCIVTHNTIPVNHITEIGVWDTGAGAQPEDIIFSLEPAWPQSPDTFVMLESTSNGRLNFWYRYITASREGRTRFKVVFCPWYAEPRHNRKTPPEGWAMLPRTKAMIETVERTSPGYMFGKTVKLDAVQAYWWEDRYEEFRGLGRTAYFLTNYPTTLDESFQVSGNRAFSVETIDALMGGIRGGIPYQFTNTQPVGKIQ